MPVTPLVLLTALPLAVTVLLYVLTALVLAFITFEIHLGWSLFRYATRRESEQTFTPPANIPQETLEWYKKAAVTKERLLLGPHQEWEMIRGGLDLRGIFFPARASDGGPAHNRGCAVIVHGWRDNRLSRALDVQLYLDQGYCVFLPSLRGHEPSGGKRIDIGCKHAGDLLAWLEEIRLRLGDRKPAFFVLDGLSMGAANVLTLSGDPGLAPDVAAVIADCGYTSLLAQGRWMVRGMKPLIRRPALLFATVFFYLLMGYTGKDPTPLTRVARARVPVLIIHGTDDNFVPAFMARELYDACSSSNKEIWCVGGAGHAMSHAVAKEDYKARKMAFIEKALGEFQPRS